MSLANGTRLGPYEILEPIGSGGMGEVYRARDTDLDRLVAIKILSARLASDPVPLTRFEREAKLASALNHPNIITIYAIGRTDENVRYIVMELVEGQTLSTLLGTERLSIRRVSDIGAQIASGLAKAHGAGIIHRDLKPHNVMVRSDGLVKLLDFGLSTLVPSVLDDEETFEGQKPITREGMILGTASYMSPEQASGRTVDFRSDQFSFGAVLYEMATGRRAFNRPTSAQTMAAIIESEPEPIARNNPAVPDGLETVIRRCLAKEPSGRFASTEDLAQDLVMLRDRFADMRSAPLEPVRPARRRRRVVTIAITIVAAVTLALAGVVLAPLVRDRLTGSGSAVPRAARQVLAVLPFANIGDDPANQPFGDGLVEILTSQLTQIGQAGGLLEVVAASDVRTSKIASAADARVRFGVSRVITGSVQRNGQRARVTINLVDAATSRQLDARSTDFELQDTAAMQDSVVKTAAAMVGASFSPDTSRAFHVGDTTVSTAYDFYLQGRGYLQHYERLESVDLAIGSFQRALEADDRYALAHAGLGEAYWRKYVLTKDRRWVDEAHTQCATALKLADGLAAGHLTLGLIAAGTGQAAQAVDELKRAIDLDPLSADAYRELANVYQTMNKPAEAEATFKKAIDVRPNYWANVNDLGRFYFTAGRFTEAEAQYQTVIGLTPDSEQAYRNLGAVYYRTKRFDLAERMFRKSADLQPNFTAFSNLGTLYFAQDRYAESARMFELAVGLSDRNSQLWSNLASALYWAPGERPKATAAYERARATAEEELQVNPNDARLLLRIADCESRLGKPARSRQLIARALALSQLPASLMFKAGTIYEQLGDRDKALEWIKKALAAGLPREEFDRSPELTGVRADARFGKS